MLLYQNIATLATIYICSWLTTKYNELCCISINLNPCSAEYLRLFSAPRAEYLRTLFISFFFFRKNYLLLSVRPFVEIISFRGISISNRPIDLKMSMNVRKGVVHIRKA